MLVFACEFSMKPWMDRWIALLVDVILPLQEGESVPFR